MHRKESDNMALKTVKAYVNGTWHTLTLNSTTGEYEKTVSDPTLSSYKEPGGYYALQVKAEDMAGNVTTVTQTHATLGEVLKLKVKEKVAPVISITAPGASAYLTSNTVVISFDVTDNDSGVDQNTISLQIDSQAAITSGLTKIAITGGYRCTYTANTADGTHTIKVNASDFDGNVAAQKIVTFTVDTVPPTLNASSPAQGLITNVQSCNVVGTTNDVTSPACTVIIKLNNVDQGAVAVSADGKFSKAVSLIKGNNTIYVKSTDKAGKYSEVTRTVIYDPDAPAIHAITITPNPVDAGATFKISVKVTD